MAAVDYARLREHLPRARLLFVAHREEILEQSLATFRHALREASFGELWVDGQRPEDFEHVFASIQSLHASGSPAWRSATTSTWSSSTSSTTRRPSRIKACSRTSRHVELLALTATPERSDGSPC
jgi:superfamily II DNA or RNA helicase